MASAELASPSSKATAVDADPFFLERLSLWNSSRDIGVAAELVAMGPAHKHQREVLEAAREVASAVLFRSTPIGDAARRLLGWKVATDGTEPTRHHGALNVAEIRGAIARARQHAFAFPRHSFAWSDLGRLYAVLGENAKAENALDKALSLAPNNRLILRNAARFHVHVDQKDRALKLLRDASATRFDPWLMSAEVAVAQSAGLPSRMASKAFRELGKADWSARSTSELKGALATLLLNDGAMSKARKTFRESLEDPTENAVAQAQWATDKTSGLVVPASALAVPQNFEAHAMRARTMGDWSGAMDACWDWANYEPTSSRPMSLGSYVAGLTLDGQATVDFAERGLAIDPDSAVFMNNKAVGLTLLMRPDEAVQALADALAKKSKPHGQHIFFLATMGLIYFRTGDPDRGREYYERAIALARPPIDPSLQSLALWHLAREEAAYSSKNLDATIARAREASKAWKETSEIKLFERNIAALQKLAPLPIGLVTAQERRNDTAIRLSEFARSEDERL